MNKVGCSKPLYATFDNGIAYGFIEGVTLNEETVRDPEIYRYICQEKKLLISLSVLKRFCIHFLYFRCICKEIIRFHSVEGDGERVPYIWTKAKLFIENGPDKFRDENRTKMYLYFSLFIFFRSVFLPFFFLVSSYPSSSPFYITLLNIGERKINQWQNYNSFV